jgi:hypothetical protein
MAGAARRDREAHPHELTLLEHRTHDARISAGGHSVRTSSMVILPIRAAMSRAAARARAIQPPYPASMRGGASISKIVRRLSMLRPAFFDESALHHAANFNC